MSVSKVATYLTNKYSSKRVKTAARRCPDCNGEGIPTVGGVSQECKTCNKTGTVGPACVVCGKSQGNPCDCLSPTLATARYLERKYAVILGAGETTMNPKRVKEIITEALMLMEQIDSDLAIGWGQGYLDTALDALNNGRIPTELELKEIIKSLRAVKSAFGTKFTPTRDEIENVKNTANV